MLELVLKWCKWKVKAGLSRSLREIHVRADVSNIVDFATKFSKIQPAFSRPKRRILCFERFGGGVCVFFLIICIFFSRRKLAKVAHYFELTLQFVDNIHDILATYLFVSFKRAHTVDRPPIQQRKQIALTVWVLADQRTCRRSMSDRKLLAFRGGPRELSGPTS